MNAPGKENFRLHFSSAFGGFEVCFGFRLRGSPRNGGSAPPVTWLSCLPLASQRTAPPVAPLNSSNGCSCH